MSHRHLNSADSILSILSCPRKEFNEVYDGGYATDALVEDAKKNHLSKPSTLTTD